MNHVLGALATTYVTCCFVYLDGPFDVFMRLRSFAAKRGIWQLHELLGCPWCTGFWCALVCAALVRHLSGVEIEWLVLMVPAYAAVAGLLLEQRHPSDEDEAILEEVHDVAQWGG